MMEEGHDNNNDHDEGDYSEDLEILALARVGTELSRQQLLKLYSSKCSDDDGAARAPLRDALLSTSPRTNVPMMLPEIREDLVEGSLGPHLGKFVDSEPGEPYATLWKKARGDVQYDGWCNTDVGHLVGRNAKGDEQCIAACMLSLLLWSDEQNIGLEQIVRELARFAMTGTSPNGKYALVPGDTCASPMRFPSTGIGGCGEFVLVDPKERDEPIGFLQVRDDAKVVREELVALFEADESPSQTDIARIMMGNAGMIHGLCFAESQLRSDGSANPYWWGPRRLEQIGIGIISF